MLSLLTLAVTVTLGSAKIGIATNPATPLTEASFFGAVREAIRLGVDGLQVSAKWSDLEPQPGRFEAKPIVDAVNMSKLLGAEMALTIQTIDTNQRTLPKDLMSEPWDSAKMSDRWQALLRSVSAAGGESIRWISLGNEVDGYLNDHTAEIDPYLSFLATGRQTLKASLPKVKVGVTTMFNMNRDRPEFVRKLNTGMDVTFFTYYPMKPDLSVRPIAEVPTDIASMSELIPDRPVILQEVGYPCSAMLASSPQQQAQFVTAVLDSMKKHEGRFALASFFLMHDLSKDQLDGLTKYYGVDAPRFRAFLGTLGLRQSDGVARPAWAALKAGLAR